MADAAVAAAVISSAVAVLVAVVGSVRTDLRVVTDRRYERRRVFLVDAQDAALALRDALREYGVALQGQARRADATGSYVLQASGGLDSAVLTAEGKVDVTTSRLEDPDVAAAIRDWHRVARVSLIDATDEEASAEQDAFDRVNDLIGLALHSTRGRVHRAARDTRRRR